MSAASRWTGAARARWPLSTLVCLLVLVTVLGLVVAGASNRNGAVPAAGFSVRVVPPDPLAFGPAPDDATLRHSFSSMARAVEDHDAKGFIRAAGATRWARVTWRSLDALHVSDVDLRLVASSLGRTSQVVTASVEVRWTPGAQPDGFDGTRTVPQQITFSVAGSGGGHAAILTAGAPADRWVPVWLAGPLHVTGVAHGAAVTIGAAQSTLGANVDVLTRRAVHAVHAVLADGPVIARRHVVVIAPATARQASQLLGVPRRELGSLAAVTTTVDGSGRANAPVQVVLNPLVFAHLTPRGAQVVVSHETTHAATGAAATRMPLWVAEGFADWVALHDGSVHVDVAAGKFWASVRRHGPPRSLPQRSAFGASGGGLGTTYEAAWTVFLLLGRRYGDASVVAFYDDVVTGTPVPVALREHTGLDVARLTAAWRSDVRLRARA